MDINEFLIDDVFKIMSQGIVVTGRVLSGRVKPGMKTKVDNQEILVKSIETFSGALQEAETDKIIGLLLAETNQAKVFKKGETLIFS